MMRSRACERPTIYGNLAVPPSSRGTPGIK